jgi:putative peptide zinc metalloprotease protein
MTIRKRPDLIARRQTHLGKSYWVVKEPIGPNYFRFQDEEYELLQKIDGNTSLDELKAWFEATYSPQKITLEELQQFIDMLQKSDLVITDEPGQEEELKKRYAEQKKKQQRCVLYFRFKVFDPDRFLNWCYPKIRWLFSVPVFIFSILLALSALTLVTVQFDLFYSKLPDFQSFFGPPNGLWLIVVLVLIKVLHEFGNELMCKHFGVECHDMGVIVMPFAPRLYSDLSDSWMLPN